MMLIQVAQTIKLKKEEGLKEYRIEADSKEIINSSNKSIVLL